MYMKNIHVCSLCPHRCMYEESGKKLNMSYSYIYEISSETKHSSYPPSEGARGHIPNTPKRTVGNSNHSISQILQLLVIFFSQNNTAVIKTTTATYVVKRMRCAWWSSMVVVAVQWDGKEPEVRATEGRIALKCFWNAYHRKQNYKILGDVPCLWKCMSTSVQVTLARSRPQAEVTLVSVCADILLVTLGTLVQSVRRTLKFLPDHWCFAGSPVPYWTTRQPDFPEKYRNFRLPRGFLCMGRGFGFVLCGLRSQD